MPIDFSSIARGAQDKVQRSGLSPYVLPAAVGALAGGPLMAYMAGRSHDNPDETPGQRRHRILRNALMGLTLGGVAGAAIPAGANMMWNSQAAPMSGFHPVDAVTNGAVKHIGATAAGMGGGLLAWHNLARNRENAGRAIAQFVRPDGMMSDKGTALSENRFQEGLLQDLSGPEASSRGAIGQLTRELNQGSGNAGAGPGALAPRWGAHELMAEAGVTPPSISSMPKNMATAMTKGLVKHLNDQGPVSRAVGSTVGLLSNAKAKLEASGHPLAKWLAGALPESHVPAELYSRYMRPSVSNIARRGGMRIGALPMAGLVGAGMVGADYMQDKLQGN